jgi:hypothetical protein
VKTKPFDQKAHDVCDPPARQAVINFIYKYWGLNATHNPDKYAVDLIIHNKLNNIGYAEIEMRDWDDCPFRTIHIPQRKKKLFDNDKKTIYFVVSASLKRLWYCDVSNILESPLVEVPNKEVKEGEFFYDVPKNLFTSVRLS